MHDRKKLPLMEEKPNLDFLTLLNRFSFSISLGFVIITITLGIGVLGFHAFDKMSWIDAFLNASLTMADMGPTVPMVTDSGKLFAAFFGLFCGLILISLIGIVFAPIIHQILERMHTTHVRRVIRKKRKKRPLK